MKKVVRTAMIVIILSFLIAPSLTQAAEAKKGGVMPGLTSCIVGPRVGLEMNEGKSVKMVEWLGLFGPLRLYTAYETGYKTNGIQGFAYSCCLGPRIGAQLDQRKVRMMEYLQLVGIGKLVTTYEAFSGKTMTAIAKKENLRK